MADTLIKGGVELFEVLTTAPSTYTAVAAPLLQEGMEGPVEEVQEVALSDGTSGSGGVRLTAAVAISYDAETPVEPFLTLDAAVDAIDVVTVQWTDGAGNVINVADANVRLDLMPIKGFGGVTTRVYRFSKTGATAGSTHTIS